MAIHDEFDFLIQWHVTERCNLACRHCYQDGRGSVELSLREIEQVLDEIGEMFSAWSDAYALSIAPSFNITGGEPLLREDLPEVLAGIRKRGYDVFLLTNGVQVDRERARQLAGPGIKGVQVSFEGCEEVHDNVRGGGSFSRATDGAERLLDAGLPVTLNVTLSRMNAKSMKKVILFASHMGVQRVGFSRMVPAGRGCELVSEMLSPAEVRALYEHIFSFDIRNLEIVTGDPVASHMRTTAKGKKRMRRSDALCGGCAAGVSGITISADGTIVPCRRMPVPLGNVRIDSLREVWALSPVPEALRDKDRYSGRCGSCGRWDSCRGCRAIAFSYSRSQGLDDYLGEDPQCFPEA